MPSRPRCAQASTSDAAHASPSRWSPREPKKRSLRRWSKRSKCVSMRRPEKVSIPQRSARRLALPPAGGSATRRSSHGANGSCSRDTAASTRSLAGASHHLLCLVPRPRWLGGHRLKTDGPAGRGGGRTPAQSRTTTLRCSCRVDERGYFPLPRQRRRAGSCRSGAQRRRPRTAETGTPSPAHAPRARTAPSTITTQPVAPTSAARRIAAPRSRCSSTKWSLPRKPRRATVVPLTTTLNGGVIGAADGLAWTRSTASPIVGESGSPSTEKKPSPGDPGSVVERQLSPALHAVGRLARELQLTQHPDGEVHALRSSDDVWRHSKGRGSTRRRYERWAKRAGHGSRRVETGAVTGVHRTGAIATGEASQVAPNILPIAHWNRIHGGELYAPLSRVDRGHRLAPNLRRRREVMRRMRRTHDRAHGRYRPNLHRQAAPRAPATTRTARRGLTTHGNRARHVAPRPTPARRPPSTQQRPASLAIHRPRPPALGMRSARASQRPLSFNHSPTALRREMGVSCRSASGGRPPHCGAQSEPLASPS